MSWEEHITNDVLSPLPPHNTSQTKHNNEETR